jgi:imidazolonepropionase-like amidohydrolase
MDNLLGQIKKGFYADIIATNDSPHEDISTLKNVVFVMKDGKVYKK